MENNETYREIRPRILEHIKLSFGERKFCKSEFKEAMKLFEMSNDALGGQLRRLRLSSWLRSKNIKNRIVKDNSE